MKNIEETNHYFIRVIEQNKLISNKHKKVCTTLDYIEHFLVAISVVTGCISISAFASFLGIPIESRSSVLRIEICTITAEIKKYKSTIKKKKKRKKKHDKIVLLPKTKLNAMEALISIDLIDLNISHGWILTIIWIFQLMIC